MIIIIIIIFILFLLYALAFAMHSHYDYWRRHLLTLFVIVASTPTVQLLCFRFIGANRNTYIRNMSWEFHPPRCVLCPLVVQALPMLPSLALLRLCQLDNDLVIRNHCIYTTRHTVVRMTYMSLYLTSTWKLFLVKVQGTPVLVTLVWPWGPGP